jgi:hypothetical protein
MRIPDGWTYVSDYCIRNGDYTICRIGGADGSRYELWKLKEQLAVNLPSAQAAIEVWNETSHLPRR